MVKKPDNAPQEESATSENTDVAIDPFYLEQVFPEAAPLLLQHEVGSVDDKSVLVALDTNALLLPYQIKAGNVTEVGKVFDRLSEEKRLFIPARVVREFLKNRDEHLGAIITDLNKRRAPHSGEMPPLLSSVAGYTAATSAYEELTKAHKNYVAALNKIVSEIKKWRGNDPVATVYARVFNKETIIDLPWDEDFKIELLKDRDWRYRHKIPPGYKDARKEDGGIGDLVIWKSLLALGEIKKTHLAFVTGEQKADWFVRADNAAVYPRHELLDEYRRASGGKSLRLMSLYELLQEMKASEEVVQEVKQAEVEANTAAIIQRATVSGIPWEPSISYLSQEATILLIEASESKDGTILSLRYLSGHSIQTNGKRFGHDKDRRVMARWEEALNELVSHGLVIPRGHKSEVFELTDVGYRLADSVRTNPLPPFPSNPSDA